MDKTDSQQEVIETTETRRQQADRVLKEAHAIFSGDTIPTEVIAETALNLLFATCNSFDNADEGDQKRYAAMMVVATNVIVGIVNEKIDSIIAAAEAKDD